MSDESNIPSPEDALQSLLQGLQSNIGRWVAGVLTPIALPVVGGLAFWLQGKLGIDMDPIEATAFIVTVVGGLAATAVTWLLNRGKHEVAAVDAIHALALAQATVANAPLDAGPQPSPDRDLR